MHKKFLHTYQVTGSAEFPQDMLRHAQSEVASAMDASIIASTDYAVRTLPGQTFVVTLTREDARWWVPSLDHSAKRWESFGWRIVENSHTMTAPGTPALAYLQGEYNKAGAPVIAVKRGEMGFYPIFTQASADDLNASNNVTRGQAKAMHVGSMMGWEVPGADPAMYNDDGTMKAALQVAEEKCIVKLPHASQVERLRAVMFSSPLKKAGFKPR